MGKIFKIVFLNVFGMLVLVLFANFFLLLVGAVNHTLLVPLKHDSRSDVVNYSDKDFGKAVYADFASLRAEYRPFVGWRRLEYHGRTTNVDKDGIRIHKGYKESSGLKRVAFFGGSTMWGTGADDNGTIPALVHELNANLSTINYGETGYNSRQELEMLINEINEGKRFDYVVFYDGVNEIGGCQPQSRAYHHGQEGVYKQKLSLSLSGMLANYFSPTLKLSNKIGEKFLKKNFYDNYTCNEDPARARQVAETMLYNWNLAKIISEEYGATFIGLLQPVAYIGSPATEHLDLDLNNVLAQQYKAVYPLIEELLRSTGVQEYRSTGASWTYDLTDSYNGSELFYVDDCHVTRNGNKRIASRIIDIIASL